MKTIVKNQILPAWRIPLIIFILLSSLPAVFGQSASDTTALIEKVFKRYQLQNPGCQFSVSRNGQLIFSKAWGSADLEHNVPLTLTSVIEAGSVSKQFTAAAILLLEQQGKLSVNDDIRKYIPELPDYGTVIRVRNLIHHTSGIKDWGSIAELTGWGRGTKTYSNQDALEISASQKTLNNVPGSEFIYSNSNYNILAIVVQRVSGMNLAEYTKKYIFIPAGMDHTQWRDNFKRVVKNRAVAYEKTDSVYQADMPNEYAYGNGGLLTTSQDLLKWNGFYLSGKFGNPSLLPRQISLDTLINGNFVYYGAGLFIQTNNGLKVIRHTGATGSYRCYLGYYPELKLSMAWMSNTSEYDASDFEVINEVEKILLPKKQPSGALGPQQDDKSAAVTLPLAKLKTYGGWYRNVLTDGGVQIVLKDDQLLFNNRSPLVPIGDHLFKFAGDNLVSFDLKTKGFKVISSDKDTTDFVAALPAKLNLTASKQYSGKYYSQESGSWISVSVSGDTLKMNLSGTRSYLLTPTYKDGFLAKGSGGIVYFERDKRNAISKMRISQSRARKVMFVKTAQ
jgi:CubicO group peptidase (beta-lactamase class C family)